MSILIPTFNRAAYLENAIESARRQTYPHVEIIVSDNASTDRTEELSRKYVHDSRIRWYRQPQNVGLAANWRILLYELALGRYAKILADDDYLERPDHLQLAVDLFLSHELWVVFAGAGSFDERSGTIVDRSWIVPSVLTPEWWMSHLGDQKHGKTLFPNLTTCGLFDVVKAKELKAFMDPVFGMDYQLGCELMLSGPSGYLSGIHGIERKHPNNDGLNAQFDTVMTGLSLYSRIFSYGQSIKISEKPLREFCVRLSVVMVKGFILYTWGVVKGVSFSSWRQLCRVLNRVDPEITIRTLYRPSVIARFLLGAGPRRQAWLRLIYYRYQQWRYPSANLKK